jgi:hypothetical protein
MSYGEISVPVAIVPPISALDKSEREAEQGKGIYPKQASGGILRRPPSVSRGLVEEASAAVVVDAWYFGGTSGIIVGPDKKGRR